MIALVRDSVLSSGKNDSLKKVETARSCSVTEAMISPPTA